MLGIDCFQKKKKKRSDRQLKPLIIVDVLEKRLLTLFMVVRKRTLCNK